MKRPPSLYTVERASDPITTVRYFGVLEDGSTAWLAPALDFLTFPSARKAASFVAFRMGPGSDDAQIVRHSIH